MLSKSIRDTFDINNNNTNNNKITHITYYSIDAMEPQNLIDGILHIRIQHTFMMYYTCELSER